MPDIATDVTGPLQAIAQVAGGVAAKNQMMKDGKPEGGGGGGRTQTGATEEEKKAAYERYKDKIRDIWSHDMDPVDRAGAIGQAVIDLGVEAGPGVLRLFGDLLKK